MLATLTDAQIDAALATTLDNTGLGQHFSTADVAVSTVGNAVTFVVRGSCNSILQQIIDSIDNPTIPSRGFLVQMSLATGSSWTQQVSPACRRIILMVDTWHT